ncbi:hypothetical protein PCE1_002107 [Barthelona sp. PCE]
MSTAPNTPGTPTQVMFDLPNRPNTTFVARNRAKSESRMIHSTNRSRKARSRAKSEKLPTPRSNQVGSVSLKDARKKLRQSHTVSPVKKRRVYKKVLEDRKLEMYRESLVEWVYGKKKKKKAKKITSRDKAAIVIQRVFRGYIARKTFRRWFKKIHTRGMAILELKDSEERYLGDLNKINDLYNDKGATGFSSAETTLLFGSVEPLIQFSQQIFNSLTQYINDWINEHDVLAGCTIGAWALENLTPASLAIFNSYVSQFDNVLKTLNEKKKPSSTIVKFLQRYNMTIHTLPSLLVHPVQRAPRYPLVLKEIAKNTPVWHPDYNSINDAVAQTENAVSSINETKRFTEQLMKKSMELKRFGNINPYVWSLEVNEATDFNIAKFEPVLKQHRMVILSDRILVGSPKFIGSGLNCVHALALDGLVHEELPKYIARGLHIRARDIPVDCGEMDREDIEKHDFTDLVFKFSTKKEMIRWKSIITGAVVAYKESQDTNLEDLLGVAPIDTVSGNDVVASMPPKSSSRTSTSPLRQSVSSVDIDRRMSSFSSGVTNTDSLSPTKSPKGKSSAISMLNAAGSTQSVDASVFKQLVNSSSEDITKLGGGGVRHSAQIRPRTMSFSTVNNNKVAQSAPVTPISTLKTPDLDTLDSPKHSSNTSSTSASTPTLQQKPPIY